MVVLNCNVLKILPFETTDRRFDISLNTLFLMDIGYPADKGKLALTLKCYGMTS